MSESTRMSKQEAMRYLMLHRRGSLAELKEHIGQDRTTEFEYLGYIKNDIFGKEKTYMTSHTLLEDCKIFYNKEKNFKNIIPDMLFGMFFKLHW